MTQACLISHFNSKWGIKISPSLMSSVLKESSKWLATDSSNAARMSNRACANKQLEDVLYLWFITNGPAGKGGDISGDVLRKMAAVLAKDSRFEVDPNFKFSNL